MERFKSSLKWSLAVLWRTADGDIEGDGTRSDGGVGSMERILWAYTEEKLLGELNITRNVGHEMEEMLS